jgi:NADH:ubiquinone oxidoreductase subunit 5 (subunit L)/multisubunit Na+/H+ antiporter MnhA subunit
MDAFWNPQLMGNLLWLILFFPLAGAVINGLLGRRFPARLIHLIGCASVLVAFLMSVAGFLTLIAVKEPQQRLLIQSVYQWLVTVWDQGQFSLEVAFVWWSPASVS